MKISTEGRDNKCARLRKWHKKFVFFPKHIDNGYQFLCYVVRKYDNSSDCYSFGRLTLYKYRDITEYIVTKLKD